MESLLQLHLESDPRKLETENLTKAENEEPKPVVSSKRLSRIMNRAAHKAAGEYGRGGSGIFSK